MDARKAGQASAALTRACRYCVGYCSSSMGSLVWASTRVGKIRDKRGSHAETRFSTSCHLQLPVNCREVFILSQNRKGSAAVLWL